MLERLCESSICEQYLRYVYVSFQQHCFLGVYENKMFMNNPIISTKARYIVFHKLHCIISVLNTNRNGKLIFYFFYKKAQYFWELQISLSKETTVLWERNYPQK